MKKRTAVWCAALLLLLAVGTAVNVPGSFLGDGGAAVAEKAGSSPGEILPDFTVGCLDGSVFTLSEHRGETAVINLWATWCAPCVEELPHFERLLREHGDGTAVLALHSDLVTEDVEAWVAGHGIALPFAVAESRELTDMLGGGDVLPRTVVVSPEGVVLYNAAGSVTYEELLRITGLGE